MRGLARRAIFGIVLVLGAAAAAHAQGDAEPVVRPLLLNTTRIDSWSFFTPPAGGGDPDYTLISNRARLGVEVEARRLSFEGSFQYAQIVGLPSDAFRPGPLGPGALYFAASRTPQAYQLYFKTMSVAFTDVVPRLSLRGGRMSYASAEGTPHEGKLVDGAAWTVFERSFDGLRADYRGSHLRVHASFLMPTQGGFEESASPTMGRVQIASGEVRGGSGQLFAHNYRDTRGIAARPDNTGASADAVQINVQTFGASTHLFGIALWGAVQRGDWYGQPHRAFSASAEAGRVWRGAGWTPEINGGVAYASGDADPNDDRHGTFFPMLPGSRPVLLRGTIAPMNLRDLFLRMSVTPHARLHLSSAVHQFTLAQRLDRWYGGSGATAFDGAYFGFSSRGSTLRTGLGVYADLAARITLSRYWTLGATAGMMRGGDVVRRQFAGHRLWVYGVESVVEIR